MILQDIEPIIYLATFVAVIYFSKEVVDCRRMIAYYPCLRTSEMRIWLTLLSASPLILAVHPAWYWVGYIGTYCGLMGTIYTISRRANHLRNI